MLHSGNDRVAPINPMWPLLCNEVGLSYDQEERARNYQRTMLQDANTWLDRHSAQASGLVMQSFHDGLKTVANVTNERASRTKPVLSAEQRLRFLAWADKNADRIKAKFEKSRQNLGKPKESDRFQFSKNHHLAANLYILNDRLQKVVSAFPQNFSMAAPAALKRLSRRPSFESLGQQREECGKALSREGSFGSSENLKRSASSLSMEDDEDKPQPQQVSPEDGEEAAASAIEEQLGFVKELIPEYVPPVPPPARSAPVAVPSAPVPVYQYSPVPVGSSAPIPAPHSHIGRGTTHPTPIAAHPPHGVHHIQTAVHQETYSQAPPHYQQAYSHQQQTQYYQQYLGQPQGYSHPQAVHHYHQLQPQASQPAPAHAHRQPPQLAPAPQLASVPFPVPASFHQRKSSFLPPHLNVVPEEMYPSTDGAEDFFMSLMDDEDWAIGGGVDMDTGTSS
jgi:hypothetical protein